MFDKSLRAEGVKNLVKNSRSAFDCILFIVTIVLLLPNSITAENIAAVPITITSAGVFASTDNAQTTPLALTTGAQAGGLTATPDAVLSLEQVDRVLLKINPHMVLYPGSDDGVWDNEVLSSAVCDKDKLVYGRPELIVIRYLSHGSCSACGYHGIIVVDAGLNTLSAYREDSRDWDTNFEFVELKCDGTKQLRLKANESWAGGEGSEGYSFFGFDKNLRVIKLMTAEVSDLPPGDTQAGEKYPVHGQLIIGECKSGEYRDIIIDKKCEHYDEYYSEKEGENVKDYLEKSWTVREIWKYTGSGYELYKKTEKDREKKAKKSKLKPWMQMGG